MKYLFNYAWLLVFAAIPNAHNESVAFPEQVKGVVVDNSTGAPIEKAYLYIVSGEEEALTTKDGSFELTTWQKFPVSIEVQHQQYQTTTVVFKTTADKAIIKLQLKK